MEQAQQDLHHLDIIPILDRIMQSLMPLMTPPLIFKANQMNTIRYFFCSWSFYRPSFLICVIHFALSCTVICLNRIVKYNIRLMYHHLCNFMPKYAFSNHIHHKSKVSSSHPSYIRKQVSSLIISGKHR
jgi:hypothetical protein